MTWPQSMRHEATIDGQVIHMQPQAAAMLLQLLLTPPWRFVETEELIEAIWPDADRQALTAGVIVKIYAWQLRRLGVTVEGRDGRGRGHVAAYRVPAWARRPSMGDCDHVVQTDLRDRPDARGLRGDRPGLGVCRRTPLRAAPAAACRRPIATDVASGAQGRR